MKFKSAVRKTLAIATVAATVSAAGALSVSAAGLRDVFSAKYYADQYADVKAVFGDDEEALYQHYLTYGIAEGRSASPVFDVVAYRAAYGDLNAAFGDNWDAYVNHYFAYGIGEQRISGGTFDPVAYAAAYPDVKAEFGDDWEAIINHYLTYGIAEGRTAGVTLVTGSGQTIQSAASAATSSGSSICDREGHNWSNMDGVCSDCGYECPHESIDWDNISSGEQCTTCGFVFEGYF